MDEDEFPVVCETCLGENPFVRMTKEKHGKACKICERPFTVYRWKPGPHARYKKTELCGTCAKMKNVCATCVLDLTYGLPVQVRDAALADHEKVNVPKSETMLNWQNEQFDKQVALGNTPNYGKVQGSAMLKSLQRRTPYYKRNRAHICSFFVRGDCIRGASCPFRHEMPTTGPLAKQNIKDRFYGVNDPVAEKMLNNYAGRGNGDGAGNGGPPRGGPGGPNQRQSTGPPVPPSDTTITTLYVGGIDDRFRESDLKEKFEKHGALAHISMIADRGIAFVKFLRRLDAEKAAQALWKDCIIYGTRLRIQWKRPKPESGSKPPSAPPGMSSAHTAPPGMPGPPGMGSLPRMPPPPSHAAPPPPGMPGSSTQYGSTAPLGYASYM